jgi:hypothetical protein
MKVRTRCWWALVRAPHALPVIFATREDARRNRDFDETLVRVQVMACHPKDRALKLPARPGRARSGRS